MKVLVATVLLVTVWTCAEGLTTSKPLNTYSGPTLNVELYHTKKSHYSEEFNDPKWKYQWYVQDYRVTNGPVMDHDVVDVYAMNYNGTGITVAVLGEGVQHGHPDIDDDGKGEDNLLNEYGFDFCKNIKGSDTELSTNATKAAGVIAMKEDNEICGAGIAHEAKIIGVRVSCVDDDGVSDKGVIEANGLKHEIGRVDIYSNTWGPKDDGKTMDKIDAAIEAALLEGVTNGRGGKGAIYLFDAGDGRAEGDNCAADDIVNDVHTIAIAGATQRGRTAWYSERCPGVMATAYSGGLDVDGDGKIDGVVSIENNKECTTEFVGTTAATPIAAGIIALALEANKKLTYRDVMHLIAYTSEVAPLADNCDNTWRKNAAGFFVSNDFGFGLLNGENIVRMAQEFKGVPDYLTCEVSAKIPTPVEFHGLDEAVIEIDTKPCQNVANDVNFLEHIELVSTIEIGDRGDIEIDIISPLGTYSDLLDPRVKDDGKDGLNGFSIKSVQNWGENPEGKWTVIVKQTDLDKNSADDEGTVKELKLIMHGTGTKPLHYAKDREYQTFRLNNGETSE